MRQSASGLEGVKGAPHILISVEYQLKSVLDIVELIAQNTIETNLSELTASWRDVNAKGQIAPTQELGRSVHSLGNIEALKVPSAKIPNAYNLVIFPDRLSGTSNVRVYDDSGLINARIP